MRSNVRKIVLKDLSSTHKVFTDKQKQLSYKKVVSTHELAMLLVKKGEVLDEVLKENLGSVLLCFGEIEHIEEYGMRIPKETEEERR